MEKEMTEDIEVLKKKADALLDTPIVITIPIEPQKQSFLKRLKIWAKLQAPDPTERVFTITGATLRTMLKISRLLLCINYTPEPSESESRLEWAYRCISDNMELSVEIIAVAIHNKNSEHPRELVDLLLDSCNSLNHRKIAFNIIDKLDVFTFTNTITSIRKITLLQEVSPSPAEIIAPEKQITGEQLEVLSNILGSAIPR